MRITWRGLELPTRVERDTLVSTEKFGRFYIEPFERGFGTTIGNSLRRVLLSSLEGSAVGSIKITGVSHEFSSIPGVAEDVTEIVLNVKNLVVRLASDEPKTMTVTANKAGTITAADVKADAAIEIINQDQVLATLTEDVKFEMEMVVEKGRGYLSSGERTAAAEKSDQEIGIILLDSVFSPVTRVRYTTEDTRVGQRTNYDRLILDIWTNGTVTPEMALVEAAKILRKHMNPLVQYFTLGDDTVAESITEAEEVRSQEEARQELINKLRTSIKDLDFSVRAVNCLEAININTVAQLVQMHQTDLMKVHSFGKTTLKEVKEKLDELGLSLGMANVSELLEQQLK